MKPRLRKCEPWEPRRGRKRDVAATEWHALLAPAIKSPGTWFMVEPYYVSSTAASSAAFDISSGRNLSVPGGRWDATSRLVEEDDEIVGTALFVRYIGD